MSSSRYPARRNGPTSKNTSISGIPRAPQGSNPHSGFRRHHHEKTGGESGTGASLPLLNLSKLKSTYEHDQSAFSGQTSNRRRGYGRNETFADGNAGGHGASTHRVIQKERANQGNYPTVFNDSLSNNSSHSNASGYGGMYTSRTKGGSSSRRQDTSGSRTARAGSKAGPSPMGSSSRASSHTRGDSGAGGRNDGLPLSPAAALKLYYTNFTEYEQGEVLDYPHVYFTGNISAKARTPANASYNHGFDDERGDYTVVTRDHIIYRYEIMGMLGKGSFGQVVKCYDHKKNCLVALKIIRNKSRFHHQALVEVKILEHLRNKDPDGTSNVIHLIEYFYFRHHLCITFELLSLNLYEFLKSNKFHGLSLGLIRRISVQLLTSLEYLYREKIIHCDLKPENILLRHPNKAGIRVIDFGSSCFEDERVYTYIQSRFYRSPEVILGLPYGRPIDMWSFACILAELYTGYPLFPGENEVEQLACIMEIMGLPPSHMVESSNRRKVFFDSSGNPRLVPNSRGKKRRPGTKDLAAVVKCNDRTFIDFLQQCLRWDPSERLTPAQAMRHEWMAENTNAARNPSLPDPRAARSRRRTQGGSTSDAAKGLFPAIGTSK